MKHIPFTPNPANLAIIKSSGADLLWPPQVTDIAISIPGGHPTIRDIVSAPIFRREVLRPGRPWAKLLKGEVELLADVVRGGDRRFVNAYLAAVIRRKSFGGLLRSRQGDAMSAAFVAWAGLVSEYRPRTPFSAWISSYLGLRICSMLGKEFPLEFCEPLDFDFPADAPAPISDRERLFVEAVVPALVAASAEPQARKVVEGWLFSRQPLPEVARQAHVSHSLAWRIVNGILRSAILASGKTPPRRRLDVVTIAEVITHYIPRQAFSKLICRPYQLAVSNASASPSPDFSTRYCPNP
ncbi:MAG: hypothetical protein ACOYM3_11345 [Terrimicrobiaceae bacterium]